MVIRAPSKQRQQL
uniref:Uncharacterized protein n=1 Tax=Arundo donax TaxID=35708 RepID=A0A0A9A8K7_ARUDO